MVKMAGNNVELKVPVDAAYVSVVRLLVSGLATRMGLSIEDLEKLKLVIGEAFLSVVNGSSRDQGLIRLKWVEATDSITVSLFDAAGQRKEVVSAVELELLKSLGGEYTSTTVDGVDKLDIGFTIKYQEDRPFLFHERESGQA
ncbi:hypothetical protein JW859_06440 [bacterium]|nr:hypothetical protein [bacterium]